MPRLLMTAGAQLSMSADRPAGTWQADGSRHTDGSGYADVYLPGPCTGR